MQMMISQEKITNKGRVKFGRTKKKQQMSETMD